MTEGQLIKKFETLDDGINRKKILSALKKQPQGQNRNPHVVRYMGDYGKDVLRLRERGNKALRKDLDDLDNKVMNHKLVRQLMNTILQGREKRGNELITYVSNELKINIPKNLMLLILSFEEQTELIEETSQELDSQN